MSAFLAASFGELAPYLHGAGYAVVPIKPGGKAPLIAGWQEPRSPENYLPKCASWGAGILTETCPAVDLDIRDRGIVRALDYLAIEMLGGTAVRFGARPKVLLPFSTSEPFDKISGRWVGLPGEDWSAETYQPHRVEVLGRGQQFVAYAVHPGTRRPYRWCRGEPMDTMLIDLPEIDQVMVADYVAAAEQVMLEAGGIPLRRVDKRYILDVPKPPPAPEPERRRERAAASGPIDFRWQQFEPERLAKLIDAEHAVALKIGRGWITSCPAHASKGHRSLGITRRDGGGSVVFCHADCEFLEIARAITTIVGRAAP